MTVPLMVLAAGSVLAGWLGMPKLWVCPHSSGGFEGWLEPVFETRARAGARGREQPEHALRMVHDGRLRGARRRRHCVAYTSTCGCKPEQRPTGGLLYPVLLNKWYVDEIYDAVFVRGMSLGGGELMASFDRNVVDGGVNGTALVHAIRLDAFRCGGTPGSSMGW